MKKLNYLLFVLFMGIVVASCSNDDDNTVVTNFENMNVTDHYYTNNSGTLEGYYYHSTFQDNNKLLTFDYYVGNWSGAGFAGFTYTNSTDTKTGNSAASICGAGKTGSMYLATYASDYTPSRFKINDAANYSINGCYISNSVYSYNSMTTNDYSPATKFKKGSWYKVTATGYAADGTTKVGNTSIYLANYTADTDTPSKEWQWFDLSTLKDAVYVRFDVTSSDTGTYGVNTATYFCIDGVTLNQK